MKLKKTIIVILLLIAIMSIPAGFTSDADEIQLQANGNNLMMNEYSGEGIISDSVNDNPCCLESGEGNDEASQSGISSTSSSAGLSSSLEENLPDLNSSFAEIEIICSDENTIFVNSSYNGEEQLGTQSNPFKTLEGAFDLFKSGSNRKNNIFLAKGTYGLSSPLSVSKALNLIGENSSATIIRGLNENQLIHISSSNILVNIINLTLKNGLNHKGGAIYASKCYLNIINTTFYDNHAKGVYTNRGGRGGAIYNEGGFVKIYGSTFSGNSIYGKNTKCGGAIFNDLGELSVFNSKFINNGIQGDCGAGGAIYNYKGFLNFFNSSILDSRLSDSSSSLGGAICIWDGRNSYIINSTISGNTIDGDYVFGSAIAHKGVLLGIINSTISNNYANGTSVANSTVYNINGIYNWANTSFEGNSLKSLSLNLLLCLEDQLAISNIADGGSLNELPSHYDLREEGLVTSIKDQKPGGDCWAFAIYASLESYLLKNEGIAYDFSENNMKNLMYINGAQGTQWTSGGNHYMAFAYLLRGSGPVYESLDPFAASSLISPENLEISKYVTGFKYIPLRLNSLDNDQIKYAILQYGALYTSIYSSGMSHSTNIYHSTSENNDHAVAIVGWDDNYSASNFGSNRPPGDGAWIVKNSWGDSYGQGGYYYVSYYDSTFPGVTEQFAAIAITSVDNKSEYRSIYQYDPLGNTYESIGYNTNTAWLANQFTANSGNPLKAFGLYTFGSSSYLVNITVNGVSKLVQEGNLIGAGYHTVRLDSLVGLSKGDVFKITVKLTTPDSLFPIAIESRRSDYSIKVSASLGQSFISPDGINWYDMAKDTSVVKFYEDMTKVTLSKTNVCLKAYTEYADDLYIDIKTNASIFTDGDLIEFTISILNNGDSATGIEIGSILDDSVDIVSYSLTKGLFDQSTGIWTFESLGHGKKETLNLTLRFNEYESYVTTSFYAKTMSLSFKEIVSNSYNVRYASGTQIIASNINVPTVVISTDGRTGKYLKITLKDEKGNPLVGKRVVFTLNNCSYYRTTNSKGEASLQINIAKAGTYAFKISFSGEGRLSGSSKTVKVYVKKQSLRLNVPNKTYRLRNNGKYLTASLLNSKGKAIKGKKIILTVNGKKYITKTNSKGIVKIKVKLSSRKTYWFTVKFAGDNSYNGVSKKARVRIR